MPADRFISREELLGGLGMPARQASVLLFNIESRTARFVHESRQAMAVYLTETAAEADNEAFLKAIAEGGSLPLEPSIQDIERFAPQWTDLVIENPVVRAAVANRMAKKYVFTKASTPRLYAALGLADPAVGAAYERLFGSPLETIFVPSLAFRERARWTWNSTAAWLESRPPFWTAFALVLTETVGAGILALPIALASVGPIAGVFLLLILGAVNALTIAATAEAMARHGGLRYGRVYFGRVVGDYLGVSGSVIFVCALLVLNAVNILAYYIGIGLTLSDATGLPAIVWTAGIFAVGLYFLGGKNLNSTVATALVVGGVNIFLILILTGLAFSHFDPSNLAYVNLPLVNGQAFDASILQTIFGVTMLAYFGHTSAGNCAQVVLRRDGSARSLIWGCVAATLAAMVLYCLWVVAVTGSIAPQVLANEQGTALGPLAAQFGTGILLVGTVFVVLSMGMGSIHTALGLGYLVRERLPASLGRGREYALMISPLVLIFLVTAGLLLTGRESFTRPLSFAGTITATVVGGVFPMLMLVASRRKGERVPVKILRGLGHPAVVAGLCTIFVGSLILHGTVIWEQPLERAAALFVGAVLIVAFIMMLRRGQFRSRVVLELAIDETRPSLTRFAAIANGQYLVPDVTLGYGTDELSLDSTGTIRDAGRLKRVEVHLPRDSSKEFKVWVHRVSRDGISQRVPGRVDIEGDGVRQEYELAKSGEVVGKLGPGANRITITLTTGQPANEGR